VTKGFIYTTTSHIIFISKVWSLPLNMEPLPWWQMLD